MCKRDDDFYDKFDEFLQKVQGNQYQLNIKKLLFKKGSIMI